jgi:hypothetical protein
VEGEDRVGEIGCELPFLGAMYGCIESVVEVQPFVGCAGFAEKSVVLERLLRVSGETI